jgi:aerobic carbon-monoxide dehydrogenase large subunit
VTVVPPSMFGVPQPRSEDARFLRGEGRFIENVAIPGGLRAVFVRSIMPHASVRRVEVPALGSMPGVVAVFTASDLDLAPMPPSGNVEGATGELDGPFVREPLARGVVRFAGEPVAVVIAESAAEAEDAAELILPDLEPLDAVTDPAEAAGEGAPLLWPGVGTNVADSFSSSWDEDVLAEADVIARGRFVMPRVAPCPMEANGIAVIPEGDERYTVWVSTQVPFDVRDDMADVLGVAKHRVRTIAPDVGGGFGAKLQNYPEYLVVAAAARVLGRPVRWHETRSESMLGLTHGRGQIQDVEIGATRDGSIVGMRVDILADMGAYPIGAFLPTTTQEMLTGVYRIPRIASRARSVVTNATPVGPYRGAGRPEATACVERAVDLLAVELGMDPVALRRINLIPPDAFPFTTASGSTYDTGSYEVALDAALELAGYGKLRNDQAVRRAQPGSALLGIGVAIYVEVTSFRSREFASVEVHTDGSVTVLTGTSPHGQGHETAFAQIAAGVLGVPFEAVRVVHSDTAVVRSGAGTWGSRSLQAGGSSVLERSNEVLETGRRLAAELLEVDESDVELESGSFHVAGAPDRAVSWQELAVAAGDARTTFADSGPLRSEGKYREPDSTFPFGAHVAVVEVDPDTGDVRLLRYVAVDDCGRILNPMLVDGQVHGGLGQGIAQALFEEFRFDEAGNPLTGTLATYPMPAASELPSFEIAHTETPTPVNPLGAKGIGESAAIGSTPAIQNAVVDALSVLGVRHIDLPVTPERVLRAVARYRAGP